MNSYTTDTYRAFLRERLEPLALVAISQLREFLALPRPPGAQRMDAVVAADPLGGRLAITLRLWENAGSMEGIIYREWSPAWGPVLSPDAQAEARRYHEAGVETLEIELQTVIEWFAVCWKAAGGAEIGLPAHVGICNDLEALNLDTLTWEALPVSSFPCKGEKFYGQA